MGQTYADQRKAKLSFYKTFTGISLNNGQWRGKEYSHILPESLRALNIIDRISDDFWNYAASNGITLRSDFHHLNSSQALCCNLFFSLFASDPRLLTFVLHRILEVRPVNEVPWEEVQAMLRTVRGNQHAASASALENKFLAINRIIDCAFEKVVDKAEGTNFDFFVALDKGHRVLFEIKYTEGSFGRACSNKGHVDKYNTVYKTKLNSILRPQFNNEAFVFEHYQIIRNLSYIDDKTTVVFLFPEGNRQLQGTEKLIKEIVLPEKQEHVIVYHLENLVRLIINTPYLHRVQPVYEIFRQKYFD